MATDAGFPTLKPAFTALLNIAPGLPVGTLSAGQNLTWVNILSGTLVSEPDYPVKVNANLVSGADWIHGDPDGKIQRLDVRSIFKTDDGALLNFSYLGAIHMDSEIASIFQGTAKPGLVTSWRGVTHKFLQTGTEAYKRLENDVFIAVGRFHVKEDAVVVEYKISYVEHE
ncbi:hypothetical protein TWF106_006900 [Orbilia oligospora]|uniref:Uncharacterized protein n=1 Tax=Orbilia oligospora TaxID=2813651 RepID=A0A6G1M248_ORBOL|nr:hypothetical protein TWF788_005395 [Orbilia oligospora]KAF3209469.1 hypothetical protein TWF191_000382 [Orbilia oligospora]KAF3219746.1 hypothetical protein TWF106_006900 [Orbilia oligospora]KAF3221421.1 hypothetical protein TWF679_008108 [Orbilia oligospora]KAF3242607.1 hypothetical protein TWF192_008611 [Orbilia oligospora]